MSETIVTSSNRFAGLLTYDDIRQEAVNLREAVDYSLMGLGDLVNFACPVRTAGRPKKGGFKITVSQLAKDIGEDRATLSDAAGNAQFWPEEVREELPKQAGFKMLSRARKSTGWKGSVPYAPEVLEQLRKAAFEFLVAFVEGPVKREPLTVGQMLNRVVDTIEKVLEKKDPELEPFREELKSIGFRVNVIVSALPWEEDEDDA